MKGLDFLVLETLSPIYLGWTLIWVYVIQKILFFMVSNFLFPRLLADIAHRLFKYVHFIILLFPKCQSFLNPFPTAV